MSGAEDIKEAFSRVLIQQAILFCPSPSAPSGQTENSLGVIEYAPVSTIHGPGVCDILRPSKTESSVTPTGRSVAYKNN